METAITKISTNGQVVIPRDIRKTAGITAATKFLVIEHNGTIILQKLTKEMFGKETELIESLARAQEDVRKGRTITLSSTATADDIHQTLKKWKSSSRQNSRKSTAKSKTSLSR